MKPLALICGLSLLANAILAVVVATKQSSSSGLQTGVFGPKAGSTSSSASAAGSASGKESMDTSKQDPQMWARLQSAEPGGLVARLRAAGFPPNVIRAIIAQQVSEQFAARRKELLANQSEAPYWKRNMFSNDPKTSAALRDLNREQARTVKELLGPDANEGPEELQSYQRRQFGNLSPGKAEQAQTILTDYNELRSEIYSITNGMMMPEDREKIALLEKEQRSDLAALLTPQEMQDYELRSSTTANMLRYQLSTFNPTEAEFRAIFEATRAAEEKYGSLGIGQVSMDQATRLRNAVLEQEQALLPPERFAELKQATDPAYSMINRLVARLELPSSTASQVVAVQQDVQQRASAVRQDKTLTPDQRTAQLSALSQEATSKLTTTLTPRGLEAYKQYGGGWLQNLTPRPAPNSTTAPTMNFRPSP